MINKEKWINSLPNNNSKQLNHEFNQVDNERWERTISKNNEQENNYKWENTVLIEKKYSALKKYSLISALFIFGLVFVSIVKNETRNLEKIINNLKASNKIIKFNLDQAILDNEVITSPENISRLAKEYLNTNYVAYKKSQIRNLNDKIETTNKLSKKNNKLSTKIKKKIKKKKAEIKKLKELYEKPEEIPNTVKTQVAKKINEKKVELKNLYNAPTEMITLQKIQKWGVMQVVKVFLGMPIIPGK